MATYKERPFAPDGKDRLGNYNLKNLLGALQEGKAKEDWDPCWGSINSDLGLHFSFAENQLRTNVGIEIPSLLSDNLGFDKLEWQIKKINRFNNSSTLLLGFSPEDKGEISINQALATIDIEQRSIAGEEDGFGHNAYEPFHFGITGINREQNRIIAAKYDLGNNNRLTELNVSISQEEYLHLLIESSKLDNVKKVTARIPTNIDEPYKTAGLITKAMYNALITDNNPFHHEYVLIFKFNKSNPIFKEAGYYAARKAEIVTVALKEEATKENDFSPCKISVPEALPKV